MVEDRLRDWQQRERSYGEQDKPPAAKVARARQCYHRQTRLRLRQALRLVVDAPVRKVQLDQLSLFDEDECGTSTVEGADRRQPQGAK